MNRRTALFLAAALGTLMIAFGVEASLLNVWHLPQNQEPPGVSMRNPLHPAASGGRVYFYVGGWPQGTIWGGSLKYRNAADQNWSTALLGWDANIGENEYWLASFPETFVEGNTWQYYFVLTGGPDTNTTYLSGDDNASVATVLEAAAQIQPYSFVIAAAPPTSTETPVPPTSTSTATPAPSTPTPTATVFLANVWHIPVATEPPSATMRNPVYPHYGNLTVHIYLGGFPQGVVQGAQLHYRKAGDPSWQMAIMPWDSLNNGNDYFHYELALTSIGPGESVEYYLGAHVPAFPDTYIFGDVNRSYRTNNDAEAMQAPFHFILLPPGETPTPTATATPSVTGTPALLNVWHLPKNQEPPAVTMRNPLHPDEGTSRVHLYVGAYPQGSLSGGTLYYKAAADQNWSTWPYAWDANHSNNEYWVAFYQNHWPSGTTVQYFMEMEGNPGSTGYTYLYGDDNSSYTTAQRAVAAASPYELVIFAATPTPPPTEPPSPSPTATGATQTPVILNVWHIPTNTEPPGVTMRNPLHPLLTDSKIYFYAGGYPQGAIWSGTLKYQVHWGDPNWTTVPLRFDSNNGGNEYWIADLNNILQPGASIPYYFELHGDPGVYETTFMNGGDIFSFTTTDEQACKDYPFTVRLQDPTPTPTPALLNVWHIPQNQEPATRTMRQPFHPTTADPRVYIFCGAYPQGAIWSGKVWYKLYHGGQWADVNMAFHSNEGSNEYWVASFPNNFPYNEIAAYYLALYGNPDLSVPTFLNGNDEQSFLQSNEVNAQIYPFLYTQGGDTPTPTETPVQDTPTPMPTPTAPANRPDLELAGFWDTRLVIRQDGTMTLMALALKAANGTMQLLYQGTPLGVEATDDGRNGDLAPGDGLFTVSIPFAGQDMVLTLRAALELQAEKNGVKGGVWPYLTVE